MGMDIPARILEKILEYGAKAPSGDNCQPWAFRREGAELLLLNDEDADNSMYNTRNIASFAAHGALIENISIAARRFGYGLDADLFPGGYGENTVAALRFHPAPESADPLLPFIEKRCTNRLAYNGAPLPQEAKQALLECAKGAKDGGLYLVEGKKELKSVAKAACLNDRLLFENRRLHDFLFDHIRWSSEEAEATLDGMDIRTLGLNAVQQRLFRLLRPWWTVAALNRLGFSRFVPMQSYKLCTGSSAMGLVQSNGTGAKALVHGGRLLQRVWLTAASLGLSFQPMTGVTYLIRRLHLEGGSDFAPEHARLLEGAERHLKQAFPIERDKAVIMLFRCGYSKPPLARSLRRRVKV